MMRIRLLDRSLLTIFVLITVLPVSTAACMPLTYSSPEIEARVVDEATGQPLEGVIVVAHWELQGGFFHGRAVGELVVQETVTNAQGFFVLPAWGPKLHSPLSRLYSDDPQVKVFQRGYEVLYLPHSDDLSQELAPSTLPLPRWHHTTLRLKKFAGSLEEYAKQLGFLDDALRFAFKYDDCTWKKLPRMLVAMHRENQRFIEQGLRPSSNYPSSIETREGDNTPALKKCGSVQEFLRSHLQ